MTHRWGAKPSTNHSDLESGVHSDWPGVSHVPIHMVLVLEGRMSSHQSHRMGSLWERGCLVLEEGEEICVKQTNSDNSRWLFLLGLVPWLLGSPHTCLTFLSRPLCGSNLLLPSTFPNPTRPSRLKPQETLRKYFTGPFGSWQNAEEVSQGRQVFCWIEIRGSILATYFPHSYVRLYAGQGFLVERIDLYLHIFITPTWCVTEHSVFTSRFYGYCFIFSCCWMLHSYEVDLIFVSLDMTCLCCFC